MVHQTMKTHIALPLLFLCLATPSCIAQAQSHSPEQQPIVLPAGEHQLPALVDQCSVHLKVNILTSPQELTGGPQGNPTVRLQQSVTLDEAGCEDFLSSVLWQRGFALTWLNQSARTMEVISLNGPMGREVLQRAVQRTVQEVLARPDSRMPVAVVVELKHVNATIAHNSLRPFFASLGSQPAALTLGTAGNGATLLVTGIQSQVAQALRIIQASDIPPAQPDSQSLEAVRLLCEKLEERVKVLEARLKQVTAPK